MTNRTPKGAGRFAMRFSLSASLIALLAAAPISTAQEESADETKRMTTVTVTSQKREQTLQDVPVAVSVIDDSVLEKAEVLDINDLQSLVPSLRVGQLQSSANTDFIIRGFGNGANNAGIEPSVGVFIDGVYRSRSASQIADLPNLQRVEVLRGPQSTLFGKNASAGVISVITEKAQFTPGGYIEGGISNFSGYRFKGDVTGPLSENVAYRLSGNYNKRDGYSDDLGTGSDVNERNRYGLRGELLFTPAENLEIRLIADYDEIDEVCCVVGNVVNGPTGAIVNALGGQIDAEDPFSYKVFYNFDSTNEITNAGISGQVDYEMDFATLTSITAFRDSDLVQNADSDFTSADLIGRNFNDTQIETFTQEVRLTSNTTGAFDWMIGGFYFDESVEIINEFYYGEDYRGYADALSDGNIAAVEALLGLPIGTTFGQAGQGLDESFGQDNTAYSIFGTLDYHVTDRLTATVGLNYTNDEKDAYGNIVTTDSFSALDFVSIGNNVIFQTAFAQTLAGLGIDATDPAQVAAFAAANPEGFAQIQAGSQAFADANDTNPELNALLGLQPLQFLPPFLNYPNSVEDGNTNDEELTYTLRLAYDVNENINVYGSYATGFKATSWNLSRDSRPFPSELAALTAAGLTVNNLTTGTRYAGPENSSVFELGIKGQFDTFGFNVAIFDQTIEDFQTNVFTGTGFALANAEEQSTLGLEFDATWLPTDNLTLSIAGTFLDPEYDSFTNSTAGDISGQTPDGISEVSLSTSANYDFTIGEMDAFVRGDWQYDGPAAYSNDPAELALYDDDREISLFNASAGVITQSDIAITVWTRNLFEEEYLSTTFPTVAQAGSISGYPNQPRTYGLTVRKSF